jgi:hypothetical protein
MKDDLDGSHALKPDGLGVHGDLTGASASWRDVEVAIKVKGDWNELIARAATYAHCLFVARETRLFALVIALNHKTSVVRSCFFVETGCGYLQRSNSAKPKASECLLVP